MDSKWAWQMRVVSFCAAICLFLSGCVISSVEDVSNGALHSQANDYGIATKSEWFNACYQGEKSSLDMTSADCRRVYFFYAGLRTEAVNAGAQSLYLHFSSDLSQVTMYSPDSDKMQTLMRRRLPSGDSVWNVEDDDTKNVRRVNGLWTVSQRGRLLYRQIKTDEDKSLGDWVDERYEGLLPAADGPGIRYRLTVRHQEHSADGYFLLLMTYLEAEAGEDATFSYVGRRFTERGTREDANAIVWHLVADHGQNQFRFLVNAQAGTLTLLGKDNSQPKSALSYELRKLSSMTSAIQTETSKKLQS